MGIEVPNTCDYMRHLVPFVNLCLWINVFFELLEKKFRFCGNIERLRTVLFVKIYREYHLMSGNKFLFVNNSPVFNRSHNSKSKKKEPTIFWLFVDQFPFWAIWPTSIWWYPFKFYKTIVTKPKPRKQYFFLCDLIFGIQSRPKPCSSRNIQCTITNDMFFVFCSPEGITVQNVRDQHYFSLRFIIVSNPSVMSPNMEFYLLLKGTMIDLVFLKKWAKKWINVGTEPT